MEGTLNMSCTGYLKREKKMEQGVSLVTAGSNQEASTGIAHKEKNSRKKAGRFSRLHLIRIAAIGIILALALGSIAAHAGSQKVTYNKEEYVYKVVTVKEGDSLWSIGKEFNASTTDSISEWIANVKEMNQIHGDNIRSGQQLLIYCGQSMAEATH